MSNLSDLLKNYGFESEEQQLNILRLFYYAKCFDKETLKEDLEAVGFLSGQITRALEVAEKACENKETFDAKLILDKLFYTGFGPWPEAMHLWLIRITQRDFFARKAGQERWEQKTGQWMIDHENEIKVICSQLQLEQEVAPKLKQYKGIAVFGATAPEMKMRLAYTKQLIEEKGIETERIYLLCGERPATESADGGEDYLKKVAAKNNISPGQITETHLMNYCYEEIKGASTFSRITVAVIDTPKGIKTRPTTVDTLLELTKKSPSLKGNFLFISRSPNIQAQAEDTFSTLAKSAPGITPEICGDKCENVTLSRILGAWAGALYGGFSRVACKMRSEKSLESLNEQKDNHNYNAQLKAKQNVYASLKK